MSEHIPVPRIPEGPLQTEWDEHYNQTDGALKVAARRKVYECLPEGEKPVYFDRKIIEAAEQAGLGDEATVIDIGCSYPYDLRRWLKFSIGKHKPLRKFVGIEPNMKQADGLNYWEPAYETGADEPSAPLTTTKFGKMFMGIQLIKTDANNLYQDNDSVELAAFNFSFYHIARHLQRAAIRETRKVLTKSPENPELVDGMLALSTSGNDNKEHMRENEIKIAAELSLLMGTTVTAPEPLNSGFTTEDADVLLAEEFKYVYKFEHKTDIVIKNEEEEEIVREAYRTLRDKYTDAAGNHPDEETFETAMRAIVDQEFETARTAGTQVKDTLSQALFFASDRPLDLPPEFTHIHSM